MPRPKPALGAIAVVPEGNTVSIKMADLDGWTEVARIAPGRALFPYFRLGHTVLANSFSTERSVEEMTALVYRSLVEAGAHFVDRMTKDSGEVFRTSCRTWPLN